MMDGNQLVFVEVRYRKNNLFGSAAESVSSKKQQRLIFAAQFFLQRFPRYQNHPSRFDVVSISHAASRRTQTNGRKQANGHAQEHKIDWIKNAFLIT